jgi:hypothetical protein
MSWKLESLKPIPYVEFPNVISVQVVLTDGAGETAVVSITVQRGKHSPTDLATALRQASLALFHDENAPKTLQNHYYVH